jgi:hypothetical protein
MNRLSKPVRIAASVVLYVALPLGIATAFAQPASAMPAGPYSPRSYAAPVATRAQQIAYWQTRFPGMCVKSLTAYKVVLVSTTGRARIITVSLG